MKCIPVPYNYSNSTQLSDNFCNSIGILQDTGNAEQSSGTSDQKKTGQEGSYHIIILWVWKRKNASSRL